MTVLFGIGWLVHQGGRVDMERLGEAAHRIQLRGQVALEALDSAEVDAGALGELTLEQGTFGPPIAERRRCRRGRPGRHKPSFESTGWRCWPVDSRHLEHSILSP
jgi:hypothetical protein